MSRVGAGARPCCTARCARCACCARWRRAGAADEAVGGVGAGTKVMKNGPGGLGRVHMEGLGRAAAEPHCGDSPAGARREPRLTPTCNYLRRKRLDFGVAHGSAGQGRFLGLTAAKERFRRPRGPRNSCQHTLGMLGRARTTARGTDGLPSPRAECRPQSQDPQPLGEHWTPLNKPGRTKLPNTRRAGGERAQDRRARGTAAPGE